MKIGTEAFTHAKRHCELVTKWKNYTYMWWLIMWVLFTLHKLDEMGIKRLSAITHNGFCFLNKQLLSTFKEFQLFCIGFVCICYQTFGMLVIMNLKELSMWNIPFFIQVNKVHCAMKEIIFTLEDEKNEKSLEKRDNNSLLSLYRWKKNPLPKTTHCVKEWIFNEDIHRKRGRQA